MAWHYSRVDHLVPTAVCFFCERPLRSAKGIVITDGVKEAYAGPNCAKKYLGAPEERLLDVARLALLVVSEGDPGESSGTAPQPNPTTPDPVPQRGTGSSSTTPVARAPLPPLDSVAQYLRLRYEIMGAFKFHKSALLTEAYDSLKSGEMDEILRKRVAGTMRSAAENQTVFSERNTKICVAMNHWLQEAVRETPKERAGFLQGMLSALHSRWFLTRKQLEGINAWGEGLRKRVHDFPHLDISVFDGVVVPDFMQRSAKTDQKSS